MANESYNMEQLLCAAADKAREQERLMAELESQLAELKEELMEERCSNCHHKCSNCPWDYPEKSKQAKEQG